MSFGQTIGIKKLKKLDNLNAEHYFPENKTDIAGEQEQPKYYNI